MLLGRPYEPRNHAVLLRQYVSAPSLCIRCGHDPAHFLRGWTGRAALVRDVAWAEGSLDRGHSTLTGAVHAFGDRTTVPERVTCPRLEWLAAGRAEFIRRETVVARRIKPWCRAAFQETAWKGTLKMVVQRPSAWLTLRLPPRASTRRRVLSMSGPTSRSSDEAGGFLRPYGAKTNPIWSVSCQMRVDVEMDAIADTT